LIPILIKSEFTGLAAELAKQTSVRAWRTIMKEAHVAIGARWHKRMLPLHFKRGARNRYGYAPRKDKYKRRKARLERSGRIQGFGDQDLVYTGLLKRSALGLASIRGFPTRAKIDLTLPSYARVNFMPGRPQLANEVLAVTPDEHQTLGSVLSREIARRFKKLTGRHIVKS